MNQEEDPEGSTPLNAAEAQGLKLDHITTRGQLNQSERDNILEATNRHYPKSQGEICSEGLLLRLHQDMFGNVWNWAGKYRTSEKNIGVPSWEVAVKLRGLCEDAKLWIQSTTEPKDEIAARFHHRLVLIHPFANGNGRHSRMAADLLLIHTLGQPQFTWGQGDLTKSSETRKLYLEALKAADSRNYSLLFQFVRS